MYINENLLAHFVEDRYRAGKVGGQRGRLKDMPEQQRCGDNGKGEKLEMHYK